MMITKLNGREVEIQAIYYGATGESTGILVAVYLDDLTELDEVELSELEDQEREYLLAQYNDPYREAM